MRENILSRKPGQLPGKRLKAAVALKYRREENEAPVVTSKGKGSVAEKILGLARKNGISIYEDPDLVEVLSKLDIYEEIPPELYRVIAEILAFVYRLNKRLAK